MSEKGINDAGKIVALLIAIPILIYILIKFLIYLWVLRPGTLELDIGIFLIIVCVLIYLFFIRHKNSDAGM